jgi:4-amino-4-deoxy-L-arabinose transferase-like glycosyltransferase
MELSTRNGTLPTRPSTRRIVSELLNNRALVPYAIVAAVAIGVRYVVEILAPTTFYFADSVDYITGNSAPMHPPTITYLWRIGTLGLDSERSVVVLQSILGVLATLLLLSLLLRLVRRGIAIILALVFSLLPQQLFQERAIMTYAMEGFLVTLIFFLIAKAMRSTTAGVTSVWLLLATASTGLAAAVRPAFELPAVLLTLFIVGMWLLGSRGSRALTRDGRWVIAAGAVCAALVCPLWLANVYHDRFGVWSDSPVSGTVLFARFAPLVGCNVPKGSTAITAESVQQVCGLRFADPPGDAVVSQMWGSYPLHRTQYWFEPAWGKTELQIRSMAIDGIRGRPFSALYQVGDEVLWQLSRTPVSDLVGYSNGWPLLAPPAATWQAKELEVLKFPSQSWFGNSKGRSRYAPTPLKSIVGATLFLPQTFLWLSMLLLLAAIAQGIRRRRRRGARPLRARWHSLRNDAMRFERLCIGVASLIVIGGSVLVTAVAAPPIWSYWVPLMPGMVLLVALCIRLHGASLSSTLAQVEPAAQLLVPIQGGTNPDLGLAGIRVMRRGVRDATGPTKVVRLWKTRPFAPLSRS